ncbi:hypothetical protein NUU61_009073 [Penicillium alfredii]|uniref:Uncharacterized protein n=1 Tax=Penicillium alfredii TaxID=1506179 RepID=A0A9W9JWK3_9EURO|nr:uncharacterized protein NUU61_009073 [Penicillium alfredii]KAJ5084494.1 hypothetical protein NUU61_009073 [Penicillium alfredii]
MVWFPRQVDKAEPTWGFDIVGLLAVIGGASIEKYAYVITASFVGSIPRLMPAPETMLNINRPTRLPSLEEATVFGIYSGRKKDGLCFFGNAMHGIDSLKPYQFQAYRIAHKKDPTVAAVESLQYVKGREARNPELAISAKVPLCNFNPLDCVTLVSVLITIALFVYAGIEHDAVALLGLGTMCISTSTACLSAGWYPRMKFSGSQEPGDVIIRTLDGAIVCVTCTEAVAQELYFSTPFCDYVYQGVKHKSLLLISTVCLMASIIFFSNCTWKIQIAVGLAYIVLNLAYFVLSLAEVHPSRIWDMKSRYEVTRIENKLNDHHIQPLCDAIRVTHEVDWIKEGELLPATPAYEGWLQEAKENCRNPDYGFEESFYRWKDKIEKPLEALRHEQRLASMPKSKKMLLKKMGQLGTSV